MTNQFILNLLFFLIACLLLVSTTSALCLTNNDRIYVDKLYKSLNSLKADQYKITRLSKILNGDPGAHRARFVLAVMLEKNGYENLSIEAYRKCIKADPNNFQYHYQLLLTGVYSSNNRLIFEQLKALKKIATDDGKLLFQLGLTMDNANFTKEADLLFDQAVNAKKNRKNVAYQIAKLKFEQRNFKMAKTYIEKELGLQNPSREVISLNKRIVKELDKEAGFESGKKNNSRN